MALTLLAFIPQPSVIPGAISLPNPGGLPWSIPAFPTPTNYCTMKTESLKCTEELTKRLEDFPVAWTHSCCLRISAGFSGLFTQKGEEKRVEGWQSWLV